MTRRTFHQLCLRFVWCVRVFGPLESHFCLKGSAFLTITRPQTPHYHSHSAMAKMCLPSYLFPGLLFVSRICASSLNPSQPSPSTSLRASHSFLISIMACKREAHFYYLHHQTYTLTRSHSLHYKHTTHSSIYSLPFWSSFSRAALCKSQQHQQHTATPTSHHNNPKLVSTQGFSFRSKQSIRHPLGFSLFGE